MAEYNEDDYFNELSTSSEGINTPPDHQDESPLDTFNEAVKEIVDNIEQAFTGEEKKI